VGSRFFLKAISTSARVRMIPRIAGGTTKATADKVISKTTRGLLLPAATPAAARIPLTPPTGISFRQDLNAPPADPDD
jgi:hypothetical protein